MKSQSSEQIRGLNIHQRMIAIMKDVDYIQKGAKKVNGQYSFVSHDQVTTALRPALLEHGVLAWPSVVSNVQSGNRTEVVLDVEFINVDYPEDKIVTRAFGYGIDNSDKGPGKAISYAFKYAALKAMCIPTGDDADNDAGTKYVPPEAPAKPMPQTVSKEQVAELKSLINGDAIRMKNMLEWLKKSHGVGSIDQMPAVAYESMRPGLLAQKASEQVESKIEELAF